MANSVYFVSGAMGCIGAWTLYHLVKQGKQVISFDLSTDTQRLDKTLPKEEQNTITFIQGDLTDSDSIVETFEKHSITHVIHLAALQVPFCRANPILGSRVNVTGTVNIFEASRQSDIAHIAYASSIAVYGPPEQYGEGLIPHDAKFDPRTLYGVYKVANEGTARTYWQDHQLSSTCLRPYTVYGVGRDQGLTSEPTSALLAAAKDEPYDISFGGFMQFQWASDVAQQFILASEQSLKGAMGFNLGGTPQSVSDFADVVRQIKPNANITVAEKTLPFPRGFDDTKLRQNFDTIYETPLADGIQKTIEHFEHLHARGEI